MPARNFGNQVNNILPGGLRAGSKHKLVDVLEGQCNRVQWALWTRRPMRRV